MDWRLWPNDRAYNLKVAVRAVCRAYREGARLPYKLVVEMLEGGFEADLEKKRVERSGWGSRKRVYRGRPRFSGELVEMLWECKGCVFHRGFERRYRNPWVDLGCKAGNWLIITSKGECLGRRDSGL